MTSAIAQQDAETTAVTLRGDIAFADSSAIANWVRWTPVVGELRLRGVSPLLRTVIVTLGLSSRLRLER